MSVIKFEKITAMSASASILVERKKIQRRIWESVVSGTCNLDSYFLQERNNLEFEPSSPVSVRAISLLWSAIFFLAFLLHHFTLNLPDRGSKLFI